MKKYERIRLIASAPDLTDDFFKSSLIMIIENMQEGAFGFVINKPTDIGLNEIYSDQRATNTSGITAWQGGPVDQNRGFLMTQNSIINKLGLSELAEKEEILSFTDDIRVLSGQKFIKQFFEVYSDFNQTSRPRQTKILGAHSGPQAMIHPFKFLMGYSGWDIQQLDHEIAEGMWLEVPFDLKLVFHSNPNNVWKQALTTIGLGNIESYQVLHSEWLN